MRTFKNDAARVSLQRLSLKLLAASTACLLSACAQTTPEWDANFGN